MKEMRVLTVLAITALAACSASAGTNAWNKLVSGNASGSWNTAANPPWSAGALPGATDTADFSTLDITADSTVTLDGDKSISSLIFGDTTASSAAGWILSPGTPSTSTLTLGGTTNTFTVNALGIGKAATVSAVLTGSANLTKAGAGTLILSGANTYTGNTMDNGGTLLFGDGTTAITNNLGGSTVTVDYGGVMVITNAARVSAVNLTVAGNSNNCSVYVYGSLALSGSIWGNLLGNPNGKVAVGANGRLTASTLGTGWHPGQFQIDGSAFFSGASFLTIGATPLPFTGTGTLAFANLTLGNWTVLNSSVSHLVISNNFQFSTGANQGSSFTQTGGTVDLAATAADAIRIGSASNEVSTLTVSGGVLNATNASTVVGYDGTGVVAVAGGTANFLGLDLSRNGHAGEGRVTLSGGTLNLGASGIYSSGGTGAKTLALNGGTLGALAAWSSALDMTLGGSVAVDTTGGAVSLSGILSGAGGLTKAGNGTLTLSGTNTYSGSTTLSAGTLVIGGAGLLGGGAYAGVISGAGSLTYSASGTQTLLANNSYSGATLVNSGELVGRASGSCNNSAVTVASGATNGVKAFVYGGLQWTCAGLTYAGGAAALDFDFATTRVSTAVPPLQVNGDLTNNATLSIIVRNGYWPAAGTYPLASYTGSLNGSGSFVLASLPAGVTATLVNNTGARRLDLNVTAVPAVSQPVSTWTNLVSGYAGGTWGTAANWSGGVPNATDAVADFSALNITADSYVNNDAARTVGTLRFGDATAADRNWFVTNSTLTLATSLGQPVVTVSNQTATLSAGVLGAQGFYKDGAGTLTLSGRTNNNFSGPIIIREGVLSIISGNSISNTTGAITVAAGAAMTISDYATAKVTNSITLSGSGNGAYGALDVWQNQTLTGPIALLTDSRITVKDNCFMYGTITAGNKNLQLSQIGVTAWATYFYGSINLGTGALTLDSVYASSAGANGYEFALNAANLYSGGTVLTNYAAARLGNAGALGSGGVTLYPNARLELNTYSPMIGGLSGTGGSITDAGAAGTSTMTVNQSVDTTFAGVISNGASRVLALVKTGVGALTLAGTNTYTGATAVSGGTLCVNGSLGNTAVTVAANAVFSAGVKDGVGRASLGGTLTFQDNSRLVVDVSSGTADKVSVSGNVIIGSSVQLQLSGDQTRGMNRIVVESTGGTISGDFVLVGGATKAVTLTKVGNAVWLKIPFKGTLFRVY